MKNLLENQPDPNSFIKCIMQWNLKNKLVYYFFLFEKTNFLENKHKKLGTIVITIKTLPQISKMRLMM